ncbi:MAG: heparinase, partial [Ignavibacteria bacterium]|nr:heparinase [Ignavibacteria bacterium]
FTWLNEDRFYTITSSADSSTKIYFTRIGASDPKFNLRNDAGIMIRKKAASNVFVSIIEPHGMYDGVREFTAGSFGQIESVTVLASNNDASAIRIVGKNGIDWTLLINNGKASADEKHFISVGEKKYQWSGNYKLVRNKEKE